MKTSQFGLRELEAVELNGDHLDRTDQDVQNARRQLSAKISKGSRGTLVPVNLGRARLSSSCLGEILGAVLEGISRGRYQGRYLVVIDTGAAHEFELDAALEKESKDRQEKLVCVMRRPGETTRLSGQVDRQVERAYEFVLRHWRDADGATARRFAETDNTSIQAASNRLAKANRLGLIHPVDLQPVSGGGTEYVYVPVK